jgi:PAS domain S-box-containing protein
MQTDNATLHDTLKVYISELDEKNRELIRLEHKLQVSETKYRTLLNASPDGMLLIDLNGIITEVSEIGLELFGAESRGAMIGREISYFVPPEERITITEIMEKTIYEGLTQNIEVVIRKKNRSLFPGELSATLIQGADGTPLSFMIIVRDISQRKKAETQQLHADRMANLGEMASGIAHEINQPLNIISMVLDKILFNPSGSQNIDVEFIRKKFERIFENITRIRNIIDHIRAFSRNHDDYVLSVFNINEAVDNAVSMITEQFKHLGIGLLLNLNKDIPVIYGNTYKFEQVIVNLLVNAKDAVLEKKSLGEEYEGMKIEIRSFKADNALIVEVEDNGIGIRDDDISNVILPFYTTKGEGKGTGLGLTICYQIIKEMNGVIEIISSRSSGTKIRITIDLKNQKK